MHLVWYGLYEYNAAWLDFSFFSSSFIFFSLYSVEDNATPVFTCGWVLLLSGVGKGGGGERLCGETGMVEEAWGKRMC